MGGAALGWYLLFRYMENRSYYCLFFSSCFILKIVVVSYGQERSLHSECWKYTENIELSDVANVVM